MPKRFPRNIWIASIEMTNALNETHDLARQSFVASANTPDADLLIDGFQLGKLHEARRFIVVSTQGRGDEAALRIAVATDAAYHAFVGSRRKMAALRDKLIGEGTDPAAIDRFKAPAGLDLGAITPEEIAMSILAEITTVRRRGQRIPIQQ